MTLARVSALAVGAGAEAGIFAGINAPKDRAWVMRDVDGRFGLNMAMLPDRLTGFYAYLNVRSDLDLLLVSGGFRVYVGVGVFDAPIPGVTPTRLASTASPGPGLPPLPPMNVSIIGNVGVYIYGKILGGLLSVGGYANLQILLGLPPAFEGAVGLEACALWVLCGSVDVHCGLNAAQGFYFY